MWDSSTEYYAYFCLTDTYWLDTIPQLTTSGDRSGMQQSGVLLELEHLWT